MRVTNLPIRYFAILVVLLFPSWVIARSYQGWEKGPWNEYDLQDGISIYENDEAPGEVSAFRAEVVIDAPADKLYPLMVSHKRAANLPFMQEYKILKTVGNTTYVYQRVKNSGLSARDFTLWTRHSAPATPNSGPYEFSWGIAPKGIGPAPKADVVRAKTVGGSFVLTPIEDGKRTQTSYRFLFDPDVWAPSFIVNGELADSAVDVVKRLRKDGEKGK